MDINFDNNEAMSMKNGSVGNSAGQQIPGTEG